MGKMIITMILFFTAAPLVSTSYQNLTQLTLGNSTQLKRWYGVKQVPSSPKGPDYGQWPGPLRYCWKDKRSQTRLTDVLEQAIKRWEPAMQDSILQIQLDDKDHPLCSDQGVRTDALVISDETSDNDDWHNQNACETQATTGYYYPAEQDKDKTSEHWRHMLKFCYLMPGTENEDTPMAVVAMMHELGHAVGLAHEHQRADRDKYLHFRCQNLQGYDEAVKAVEADDEMFGDMDLNLRVTSMCSFYKPAAKHFPPALAFILGSELTTLEGNDITGDTWDSYTYSTKFSTSSIMNYAYNTYAKNPTSKNPEDWVLSRKKAQGGQVVEVPLYIGGAEDPNEAKLSVSDIARVAQLYPKPDEGSKAAMRQDRWGAVLDEMPAEGLDDDPG